MRRIVIGALLLLLALAVGAVLFARSTRALQWAASQLSAAVEQAGGRLAFTELSGSLFTAIGAARIDYEQADGTRATLTGVQIDPSLAALWHRQLVFDRIAIATAGIERPASDEPAVEPRSLALPIEVRVDRATVDRLSWRSGTTAIELAGLDFAYRGGPDRHEVDALSVRLPGLAGPAEADTVVLNLTGRIDARAPFALAAKLGVSADALGRAEAVLGGRLAEVSVEGTLAGNAARDWLKARVAATIAPFSTTMLASLRLAADGVDAAVVSKGAPRTALDVEVEAHVASGAPVRGRVRVVNRLAGEVGAGRIPVTGLDAGFEFEPAARRGVLAPLRVALAGGGSVEGRGTVALPVDGKGPAFDTTWQLSVAGLDLKALDARLVPTQLAGKVGLALSPERQRFDVALDQRGSRRPGAVAPGTTVASAVATAAADAGALHLEAVGQRTGPDLVLDRLLLRAGAAAAAAGAAGSDDGEASGRGRIRLDGERAFEGELQLRAFDPSRFIAAAGAAGVPGAAEAAKAGVPPASINATVSARGRLQPSWQARIDATLAPSRVALSAPSTAEPSPRTLALRGRVRGQFSAERIEDADILLSSGRNTLRATGSNGTPASVLEVVLDANEPSLFLPGAAGQLNAVASLTGNLGAPVAKFNLKGSRLSYAGQAVSQLGGTGDADLSRNPPRFDVALDARALTIAGAALSQANLRFGGTTTAHALSLALRGTDVDAKLLLEGGLTTPLSAARPRWAGRLVEARNDGRYPVQLAAPAALELSPVLAMLAPARLQVGEGRVQVDELRWEPGRLATRGSLSAFPAGGLVDLLMSPSPAPAPGAGPAQAGAAAKGSLAATAKAKTNASANAANPNPKAATPSASGYDSTLRIGGQWALASTPRLNGTVTLRREDGDVALRGNPPFALGLSRVELDARFVDDRLQAQAIIEGSALGEATATLALEPSPALSMASPMVLRADLAIRTLKPFERYVGAFADIDGALVARVEATGTPSKPQLSGSLRGERLRFNAPQIGVALRDGRLDARLADGVLDIVQLEAVAGEGTFSAKGRVPLREGISAATLAWRADRMTLLSRPDRRLVVDGSGTLAAEKNRLVLAGQVVAREGYIEFGRSTRTVLGEDVVVVGRSAKPAAGPARSPLAVRLDLDLGNAFRVVGSGLDALIAGKIRIASADDGTLRAVGTIATERGTFAAFGQRLDVSRGQLVFNGPIDNPGIEVVALRRLPSVEIGVEITGTVRALRVRTTSNPPMSQGERLSWLVLGRSLESASQADVAMVAGIAGSMMGGDGVPMTRRIAEAFGLDDIGIGNSSTGAIAGQVLTVGKRLSDRVYIAYEQAVSTATYLLRVDFELRRFVSLRAEAGAVSSFGIFYTRSLR
ncbi:MAG: translocation/assembly module TamB domain-containing protein [Proteobacteria bacterium]|nr:translocation/assembly module TamB domain-containing protein [Pseudomonadota bacterium]